MELAIRYIDPLSYGEINITKESELRPIAYYYYTLRIIVQRVSECEYSGGIRETAFLMRFLRQEAAATANITHLGHRKRQKGSFPDTS